MILHYRSSTIEIIKPPRSVKSCGVYGKCRIIKNTYIERMKRDDA